MPPVGRKRNGCRSAAVKQSEISAAKPGRVRPELCVGAMLRGSALVWLLLAALAAQPPQGYKTACKDVGVWLSLVEHLVRDEGVAGSNPATPTKQFNHLEFALRRAGPDMGNETS